MFPPDAQIRAMAKDVQGNIWIAEDELSCYNPKQKNLAVLFRQIKMETRVLC